MIRNVGVQSTGFAPRGHVTTSDRMTNFEGWNTYRPSKVGTQAGGPGKVQFSEKVTDFGWGGARRTRVRASRKVFRGTMKNQSKISIHIVSVHMQVTKYKLDWFTFFVLSMRNLFVLHFFSYCTQCF